jgi:hypothetical protein
MSDSSYLKKSVGDALSTGLAAIAVQQPNDSVEFLGNFLLNYVETKRGEIEVEDMRKKVKQDVMVKKAAEDDAVAEADKAAAAKAIQRQEEDKLEKDLKKASEVTECIGDVLQFLQKNAGATSAYIAHKEAVVLTEGEDPVNQLQYVNATAENAFLVGKTLAEPGEFDPEEGAPRASGITFDAWKVVEPAEPAEGEDPAEPAAPDYIHVPNTIRESRMKYYGVPKLGAFACVTFKYRTYLHANVFEDPPDPEEGQPKLSANAVPKDMVLAMDSMGQANEFSDDQLAMLQKWAALLGKELERSEAKIHSAELKKRKNIKSDNDKYIKEEYGKVTDTNATALQEAIDKLNAPAEEGQPETPEDVKEMEDKMIRLKYATELVMGKAKSQLTAIKACRTPVKPGIAKVLECVLSLLGYTKSSMYNMSNQTLDWSKMRELLDAEFFSKIQAYDGKATKPFETAETIGTFPKAMKEPDTWKAMCDVASPDELQATAIAYEYLKKWAQAAVDARVTAVTQRIAAEEARLAAEAEAAAAAED